MRDEVVSGYNQERLAVGMQPSDNQ
jgi:hypothetical protein